MKRVGSFYLTLLIPLIYAANVVAITQVWPGFVFPIGLRLLAVGFGFTGLLLWIVSYISLGNAFGVLPRKQARVRRGIYRWFSHPMYVGISMAFVGLSIANDSLPGLLFTTTLTLPLLFIRGVVESKYLKH